jgi:hypothetical protein
MGEREDRTSSSKLRTSKASFQRLLLPRSDGHCWPVPGGRPLRRRRETMLICGRQRLRGTEPQEDRRQNSERRTPNPKPQTPNSEPSLHRSSLPRSDGHCWADSQGVRSVGAVGMMLIYGRQRLRGTVPQESRIQKTEPQTPNSEPPASRSLFLLQGATAQISTARFWSVRLLSSRSVLPMPTL